MSGIQKEAMEKLHDKELTPYKRKNITSITSETTWQVFPCNKRTDRIK